MTYNVTPCTTSCALPRTARFGLLSFVANRAALLRQRRALKALDAAALEDIGITRQEALTEAARPLWDAPESWRR
ncbi:DUF1127 domain-containing protein [Pseudophaeobacter flagellatus]|uniref:DUF1127 domain-containing protein n=1 Tax=Pseudophaeobacter flagellatus TaxID=2899119 RepID=UPI001E3FF75F|nr:DUF1127 domain-containing protein [Pseudophaeobacter flagellatus]MCD9148908.1 DUF1127 domain-containing protein [Pseudophaeobacter flagellatus]